MAKYQGASGPHFFMCPKERKIDYRLRRGDAHTVSRTGRMRHRANRYGRRHQDEFRCSCGHVFWSNFYYRECPEYMGGSNYHRHAVCQATGMSPR